MDIKERDRLLEELIDVLTINQKKLDEEKLNVNELRKLVADINFTFLEILKSRKTMTDEEAINYEYEPEKISSMFS